MHVSVSNAFEGEANARHGKSRGSYQSLHVPVLSFASTIDQLCTCTIHALTLCISSYQGVSEPRAVFNHVNGRSKSLTWRRDTILHQGICLLFHVIIYLFVSPQ
jgi:hypothetical protein